MTAKLTSLQQELYDAMRNGCVCYYMPYMGRFNESAYYWRGDTHARCTKQAEALLRRGLVESFDEDVRGQHKLRIKSDADN